MSDEVNQRTLDAYVVSRIMDEKVLKGFCIVIPDINEAQRIPVSCLKNIALKDRVYFVNAEYSFEYDTLTGTQGSLTSYPTLDKHYVVTSKQGVVVTHLILSKEDRKPLGVVCFDALGTRSNLLFKSLDTLLRTGYIPCNFDMQFAEEYNMTIPVPKDGGRFKTVEMSTPKKLLGMYANDDEKAEYEKNKSIEITKSSADATPCIKVLNVNAINSSSFAKSGQEKMLQAQIALKNISPYYYTIFTALKKIFVDTNSTLGVTETTIFIDFGFIAARTVPELVFLLIHEVMHICMMCGLRKGNRNHKLWNIANDLYVNEIICRDFGIVDLGNDKEIKVGNKSYSICAEPTGFYLSKIDETIDLRYDSPETIYAKLIKENPIKSKTKKPQKQKKKEEKNKEEDEFRKKLIEAIEEMRRGVYHERKAVQHKNEDKKLLGQTEIHDGKKKLNDATLPMIIQEMMSGGVVEDSDANDKASKAEQPKNLKLAKMLGERGISNKSIIDAMKVVWDGCENVDTGVDVGKPKQILKGCTLISNGLDMLEEALSSEPQSMPDQGDGNDDFSDDGDGDGQDSSGDSDDNNNQSDSSNKSDSSSGNGAGQGSNDGNGNEEECTVTYNGKKLTGTYSNDIFTETEGVSEEARQKRIDDTRRTLQSINTKIKMEEEEGKDLSKNAGNSNGMVQRYIDFGISVGVDWKVILRKICKSGHKKTFNLAQPEPAYMSSGMTIASRQSIGKPTKIRGIKFAIDVSGSVSEQDLRIYLSEINNIFKDFDIDGELIYWSTEIGDAGLFSSLREMLRVKPKSTGGTDVLCVFQYLNGEIAVDGIKEKDKIRDMEAVFILTDGYFSENYSEYTSKFGKKVIWLITGSALHFKPPFGRVIQISEG